jgi:hypothetical protein
MKWIEALKEWNGRKGGAWCVPRRGTKEHDAVRAIMAGGRSSKIEGQGGASGEVDELAAEIDALLGEKKMSAPAPKKGETLAEKRATKTAAKELLKKVAKRKIGAALLKRVAAKRGAKKDKYI